MHKYFLIFIFIFLNALSAENVVTSISRSQIGMNESFSIEYKLSKRSHDRPDFSPLEKDFEILATSSGFNTTVINGKLSEEITWDLTLMPKREGEFTIPVIYFGSSSSIPQNIQVTKAKSPKKEDDIYIEILLNPSTNVYEQMPIIYTVRLYTSLAGTQGAISELKTSDPDAIIERYGKDNQFEMFDQTGKRRMVVERQYSVIPQRQGELIFYPTVFEGTVQAAGQSFFGQVVFKKIYSNQEKIEVKQVPAEFQNQAWFAANNVTLSEHWSKDPSKLNVGEPVTWTLTVKADGNFANQIPDLTLNLDRNLKQYPDKPETSNQVTPVGFVGTKQMKIALIPSKAGEFIIPEVTVDWWDLQTNQKRCATLPAKKISVISDEIAMEKQVLKQTFALAKDTTTKEEHALNVNVVKDENFGGNNTNEKNVFGWLLVALLVVSAFLGFGALLFKYRRHGPKEDSLRALKRKFKKACIANDAKIAEKYLLMVMGKMLPERKPLNLATIKAEFPDELKVLVDELNRALYGRQNDWEGKALWTHFSSFKPAKAGFFKKKSPKHLQELYPIS